MPSFKYTFEEIVNGIHKFFARVELLYNNSGDFDATSCKSEVIVKLKGLFASDSNEIKFVSWVKSHQDLLVILCNRCNIRFQCRGYDRVEIVIKKGLQ